MSLKYDLVVIGAGPGGEKAAMLAAQHGLKVALIEGRNLGGTCLNRGCIPVKTLLHASSLYREMKDAGGIGVFAEGLRYDMAAIYNRKDEIISGIRANIQAMLASGKVDLFYGTAKILSAVEVAVTGAEGPTVLEGARILVATGANPARPPIEGIGLPGVVTSDELLDNAVDYKSLIIIGGGVIGVEFASFFSALGCAVTIIETAERIIPNLDRELSQNLTLILKRRGVAINTGCTVEKITDTNGRLCCHFSGKGVAQALEAQGVLVSVGRQPNTEGLFGEDLDVALRRGIVIDSHFETNVKGIYAIGDVTEGSIQLAHAASAQAQNVIAQILGETPSVTLTVVPSCVYTSPEIASVGMTAEQAKSNGLAIITGKCPMSANGKTIIERQDRSFMKLIFDARSQVLLGAQLMCSRASDLISELADAIVNALTLDQLLAVIRPHPTFSEAVTEALKDAKGRFDQQS